MSSYAREPINGFTHLVGAILSFVGLLALTIVSGFPDRFCRLFEISQKGDCTPSCDNLRSPTFPSFS